MIRSFDWRDVGLVRTLGEQGVCLDSEIGLIHGSHPLQKALLAYLMPGTGAPTLVWKNDQHAAFGQLRHRFGDEQARLVYIAPECANAKDGWQPVVERLAVEAGERGAHHLIAEVNENSGEFEALRAAGFAVYARQSLWRLSAEVPTPSVRVALRPVNSADVVGVSTLYANIVPRLVQQVEPPPYHMRGYVLEQKHELVAFLHVRRGPLGFWVEPYLHPEADQLSEATLLTGLSLIPNENKKPVYVCVRRYQNWLQDILMQSGFEAMGTQAVMVKRLVARVTEPLLRPLPAIEGQVPTTTPIVRARLVRRKKEGSAGSNFIPARRELCKSELPTTFTP
ncbi:MAG TPA: hypothetical protein VI793_11145 [Anaerolineales bacterium]|nr:hypothetical protein [Anaerolineales bacterium]